ncbi:MAG TPA: ParB/RepB/Spo0J family partition protein [Bacilli bacterium]|jgi:ParB family chromosome partitioning protein|nr:ParB/RepB/Spo0J family partition protein [Bacilli bacterium]HQC83275.1 ParB/RepB/Spo0J family partition protein [Bacilli bacterium]
MKMEAQIRLVNVEDIIPNRFQPRLEFDQDALKELAESIRVHGIIQPLVLRRVSNKFEIIAGERRYKASQMVGLTQVPAIICALDDNESAEVAIIENTHRRDLSAIEEATSYKKLLDRHYLTQEQLAQRLGTSQSTIANKIRLLQLDESVQDALLKNKISERHARSLLRVTDKFKQVDLLNKTISEKWPVKKLDEEIDKVVGSYNNSASTGGINITDNGDIQTTGVDIGANENTELYQYHSKINDDNTKKSLFFNNLEDAPVTMDPTLNFGFNPFQTSKLNEESTGILDLEDEEESIDEIDKTDNKDDKDKVKEVIKEKEYKTTEDLINGIKDMINNAQLNNVDFKSEEFDFDKVYQFVIKVSKEDKKEE